MQRGFGFKESTTCGFCGRAVVLDWRTFDTGSADPVVGNALSVMTANCPACQRLSITLARYEGQTGNAMVFTPIERLRPAMGAVAPLPPEVDAGFASDFLEAAQVLTVSAKASAALSRRLLQHTIREKAGITKRRLIDEIDAVIESGDLPSNLADDLHAVRQVGNFAAHPLKDTETGAVVDVEPGEAEWLLDLLREVLDFFFVAPARRQARRDGINAKLRQAGKPELG